MVQFRKRKSDGQSFPVGNNKKIRANNPSNDVGGLILRKGTKVPQGIEPLESFTLRERAQLLSEERVSRDFTFNELDTIRIEIDNQLSIRYFELNPNRDFFSPEVAFQYEKDQGNKLDSEFDVLLTERRKIVGASNNRVVRELSGIR